jgi:hypothetical protein
MSGSDAKITKKIPKFPSKRGNRYFSPSHLKQLRTLSRDPHIFTTSKIQESLVYIFKKYELKPLDIEVLIYMTLQCFEVAPLTYESMYRIVKQHIISGFVIQQGAHIDRQDVALRRVIVYYTKEKK